VKIKFYVKQHFKSQSTTIECYSCVGAWELKLSDFVKAEKIVKSNYYEMTNSSNRFRFSKKLSLFPKRKFFIFDRIKSEIKKMKKEIEKLTGIIPEKTIDFHKN
jgi:hypothetical protein